MTKKQIQTYTPPSKCTVASPKEIYQVDCQSVNPSTKSAVLKELILKEFRSNRDRTA